LRFSINTLSRIPFFESLLARNAHSTHAVLAQQTPIPAVWQVNASLSDRRSRKLAGLGTGSRQVFANLSADDPMLTRMARIEFSK
jgi:hypothetical protein